MPASPAPSRKASLCSLISFLVLSFGPTIARADGLGGLAAGYHLFLMLIAAAWLGSLALLGAAFLVKKKGGSKWIQWLLASPAILLSIYLLLSFFWQSPDAVFLGIFLACATSLGLSLVVLTRPQQQSYLLLLAGILGLYLLINPRIFNFFNYVEIDNDPFDGRGARVKAIVDINGHATDDDGKSCFVDKIIKLENGRYYPGYFRKIPSSELSGVQSVMIEKSLFADYPYTLFISKNIPRETHEPLFDLPIINRNYELNQLIEIGGAHMVGYEQEGKDSGSPNWCS